MDFHFNYYAQINDGTATGNQETENARRLISDFKKNKIHPGWGEEIVQDELKVYWFGVIERISQKAEKAGIGQDADFVYARLAAEKMIKDAPDCDKISPETTAIVKLRDMTKKLIDEKDLRSPDILKLTARHILETYGQAREDDVIKRGYNKVEREIAKKRPKVKDLADAIKSFTTKLSDFRNSNRAFIKESIDS
ncbi:MAG: hypothetical protein LBM27_06360, partial [Lactobacillaceae bacterium]|nr:hypothetical protein [Lactobacillaceae bacterium]